MELADLHHWIEEQQSKFIDALKTLVDINTFTSNHAGVDAGMAYVDQLAAQLGLCVERVNDRHRLIKLPNPGGRRLLLLAHMDTVHPPDGDFQHYEPQADGYVRGPGIGDIKGGLLMGLWTLYALSYLQPGCDVGLVISADEEIGSPTLKDWYLDNRSRAHFAIGLEPGFPQGALTSDVAMGYVLERKGCGRFRFKLRGLPAHAGGQYEDGLSALDAMAQRVLKIHALTDLERGITTNVGWVASGTAANTIAEYAEGLVDLRFPTQAVGEAMIQVIHAVIAEQTTYNPKFDVWETVELNKLEVLLPAMERNEANQPLVSLVAEQAALLNLNMVAISRGGGSDANYTSGGGVPSICGMGAPAEGIHTPQERILLPLLWPRLELLIRTALQVISDQRFAV